jgi:protein SERAC1
MQASRPLIFIAHSLGGLVCQDVSGSLFIGFACCRTLQLNQSSIQALLASRSSPDSHLRHIYTSTIAIAFLGTPHSGVSLASVASKMARLVSPTTPHNTNLRILGVLEKDSEVLARIQDDFRGLLRARNETEGKGRRLDITCFYEELEMPGLGDIVVPIDSAVIPGYNHIGIHAHHRDIARFSDENALGFRGVVGEIQRWMEPLRVEKIEKARSHIGLTSLAGGKDTDDLQPVSRGGDVVGLQASQDGLGTITILGKVDRSIVVLGSLQQGNVTFS